ncbi:MAG: tol-pal system protein YbgF [Mariprofundus sp.]|nr:tol-pal system protein YbgF [Mariprofundus sp.]
MHHDPLYIKQRLAVHPLAVVFLCATVLTACASGDKKINWPQDKPQIQSDIQAIQHEQQVSANSLHQQSIAIETLQQKIEALEQVNIQHLATIASLSSHVEELHRPKKVIAKKKLKKPAKKATIKHPTPIAKLPLVAPTPAPIKPAVDRAALAEAEKNAYTAAYLALKSGRFDEASTAFNQQLDSYPNGEYADQAWYWLGETRFAQGDHAKAHNAFKYVADHYPNSVKHAGALLKLGQIAQQQNKHTDARNYYQHLIQSHADSSLAEQARSALSNLPASPEAPQKSSPEPSETAITENPQ